MKSLVYQAFLVLIIFASSCKSPLSNGKVEDLSAICAKIEITKTYSIGKITA